jgi:hypothetical protein
MRPLTGYLRVGAKHRKRQAEERAKRVKAAAGPVNALLRIPKELSRDDRRRLEKLLALNTKAEWTIDEKSRGTTVRCEIPVSLLSDLPENMVSVWDKTRIAYIPLAEFRSRP